MYWGNGAQILGPHDKNIQVSIPSNFTMSMPHLHPPHPQASILAHLAPEPGAFEEPSAGHPLLTDPLEEVQAAYLARLPLYNPPGMNASRTSPMVYTAMHGVGWPACLAAWTAAEFPAALLVPVEEQRDPHPDFPTVEYPNPEEGASALDLAFRTADACGARWPAPLCRVP